MDVPLEVLQHRARPAIETVTLIDEYCKLYQDLFPEVRSFEYFKYLHLGMISEIKRKTLPAIARAVGLEDAQGLHHFLWKSPWEVKNLKNRRLKILNKALNGGSFLLCIDETGDKKKGTTTDYVDRQYIGNLGKIENGIVSVNAYGIIEGITFPLIFKVFKPKKRLKSEDKYKSKPQLAIEIIKELRELGFNFNLVLADSLYGESSEFIDTLHQYNINYIVAIRSNHSVLMASGWKVRYTRWKKFDRIFSNGKSEKRFIREIVFGKRRAVRFWQITTDKITVPENTTWYIMTDLPGDIQLSVGNTYGFRTWIEYGFKQSKNELGWADYRVTDYQEIERWWEIIFSTYFMISLQSEPFKRLRHYQNDNTSHETDSIPDEITDKFCLHSWWHHETSWKSTLNNLRLIIQPKIFFCLISPWLEVFHIPDLVKGFLVLTRIMNEFKPYLPDG
ncbi:MAG: IS701 family transposase [Scytonema sp. CRU_2_7]|nr:IS701 family transposase [Scytonema sp. CRU_2_7]